ncbi:MFS general substrate transporter [Dendrothele bispora CBS 962.96]|uniref:MFS general substrate transporter n=1 Tax=Dendrothele bispora (strain CBS 962.96) TaxID=1314807 RepID=A0A4S8LCF7_DENBC|nr:MFS general substrate transporter [Dendrothele bispora CBS 962.96]
MSTERNPHSPMVTDLTRNSRETGVESAPDGGYGWVCVFCSFVVHFFALGIESSWGVYQSYYFNSKVLGDISNSDLAWVGSIQATGQPLVGFVAGLLAERIGYRITGFIGTVIMCLGLIAASFSTHVWHLYLTQGIMFGFGSGFAFIPAVTLPSQWFTKRRGLATGISVSGYGIGGLVLSPVTQSLIDAVGFRWALRTTGLMTLVALGIADYFMKSRPGISMGTIQTKVNLKLMKERVFVFLCCIGLFSAFGFYVPLFYVPDYAQNALGRSAKDGATSAALISALSAVGRVLLGLFGDRFGHITTLILCQGFGGIAQMTVWPFIHNLPGLMGFSSFYGFFSGGFVSLYPVVAADIYGVEGLASIAGAMFSSYIPGTLVGPPIAGAIIDRNTSPNGKINFLSTQLYGGSWLLGSCCMASLAMYFHRKQLKAVSHPTISGGASETEKKEQSVTVLQSVVQST